ncbi:hypothetical protein KAFR_0E02380 [Kazachstania africana CBS 2517]|uniref:Magnesium transporter n=1 Tax=Kazachstania africana (strain ATCC 22294 / BCRC 22015 / CBS 2517 / CECT 1963 / NBRC 1671 / NRRL Y-8276) TaxID=1071382 RepID=H2AVJ1_KAZAF|nr:hypothetical protein KAFR_0E02380 [Kazachstania africana CBS 2517]CCF58391.1 hypothetical protein KAFR_0E02380 [Kazachstania africana CBS 2517]
MLLPQLRVPLLRSTIPTFLFQRRCISSTFKLPSMQQKLLSLKPIKPNDTQISCTIFNHKGDVVAVSQKFQKWKFLRDHDLYPRDLRKIDTTNVDIIPNILVKYNKCIVINMLHIKAIIKKDKVYVFDTVDQAAAAKLGVLMYDLESKLNTENSNQCYEHRALESMLVNVVSSLETEYKTRQNVCKLILNDLENQIDREKLRDLLISSKELTSFYQKSLLIRDVLDELLENDEDLSGMYLNKLLTEQNDNDFSDLEMMLENYYIQFDEFVQQSESLIQDIKSTEEIVNIILDANRNSLMLLELKITIYTLGFAVAALIPAFYGMNLKNFIEDSHFGFIGAVFFSIIGGYITVKKGFQLLRNVTRLSMVSSGPRITSLNPKITTHPVNMAKKRPLWHRMLGKFKFAHKIEGPRSTWTREDKDLVWKWLIEDKKD